MLKPSVKKKEMWGWRGAWRSPGGVPLWVDQMWAVMEGWVGSGNIRT